ncbi:MAG: GTP pyrophosphokinase family protein, partial [Eubacteriales bacterium]|nr:GTP pyrophosphokinase family protein [Eubacteriales bacterium]
VVCSFEEDIYKLADALLRQDDITLIKKKDYIANPKPSGYRSLHLIVAVPIFLHNEKRIMHVEVQIRTLAMDLWASTEHKLRYKKDIENYEPLLSEELRKCADMASELDNRLQSLHAMVDGEWESEMITVGE